MVWANGETELFWLGPLFVVVLALILWRLGQQVTTRISFDIIENCDVDCIKDSVKNNWTNMAVTAALLLTLVVAMLQVDAMESNDFEMDPNRLSHLQQIYVALCLGAICCNLCSVFYCIVYLSFVDPLSQTDVMKYLLTYPDSLGDPVVWLGEGCILMWIAIAVWVFASYGLIAFIATCGFAFLFACSVAHQAITRSAFHPADQDFSWTQEDPSTWKTTFLMKHITASPAITKQVQKVGKLILEKEKEKGK